MKKYIPWIPYLIWFAGKQQDAWDWDGQKWQEGTYKDGELIEETRWDRNGNKN